MSPRRKGDSAPDATVISTSAAIESLENEGGPTLPEGHVPLGSVATVWDRLRNAGDGVDVTTDGEDAGDGVDGRQKRRRAAPFVKWAGGKRSLINELGERLPTRIENYYEPMVGGGALFFALADAGLIHGRAVLIDSVPELMTTYKVVRDQVEELIAALEVMARRHMADLEASVTGPAAYYYTVRDQGVPGLDNELAVAARFIYLNRTCFNGLYRVNSKGRFNVPMGSYKNPRILDSAGLRAASRVLNATNALLLTGDFGLLDRATQGRGDMAPVLDPDGKPLVFDGADELIAYLDSLDAEPVESAERTERIESLVEGANALLESEETEGEESGAEDPETETPTSEGAFELLIGGLGRGLTVDEWAALWPKTGDFAYFDPPYIPLIKSSFTRYTAPNFGLADQERLRDLILALTERGVAVMASNSKTPEALELYDRPGLRVETVEAPRPVNSKVEGRGPVEEILVTNYEPAGS